MMLRTALLLAVSLAVVSCGRKLRLKPSSGGEPFEVLLLTSGDAAIVTAMDSLLTVAVEGLPQREAFATVSHSRANELTRATRYARCIVSVSEDTTLTSPKIRYELDVYAQPQLIVSVTTPSARQLGRVGETLRSCIERFELAAAAKSLQREQSTSARREIERMFGRTMTVPQELTAVKHGKDFLWFSDNGATSVSSVCVYTYSANTLDAAQLLDRRDSVMAANIPGETPAMHIATERRRSVTAQRTAQRLVCRGQWLMEGDAMGGPFVSYATIDSAKGRVVVAEAFVYAPGRKKRNKMLRLEAALTTMEDKH